MKYIIVIPSWYPNLKNSLAGSFFREQCLLVNNCKENSAIVWEIKILLPVECPVSFFTYLFKKKILKKKATSQINLLMPPAGKVFNYFAIKKPRWVKNFVSLENKCDATNVNILQQQLHVFFDVNYKRQDISLLHAHSVYMGGIISRLLSNYTGIPYIITEHQLINVKDYDQALVAEIYQCYSNAKFVLTVSEYLKQYLLAVGFTGNYAVIGNYINEEIFHLKNTKLNGVIKGVCVIYDDYLKDADNFFAALQILKGKGGLANISFFVINGAPKQTAGSDTIELKAARYGVIDNCQFFYNVDRERMHDIFSQCSFMVSPSISETFGISLCEALCCGLPVVCTDSGGVRDFTNEQNSIVVEVSNPGALSNAILSIVENLGTYNSDHLRMAIIKKYGKKAFLNNISHFYNQAIA